MNVCYILVPGMRLPPDVLSEEGFLRPYELSLGKFDGKIYEEQLVDTPLLDGGADLSWLMHFFHISGPVPPTGAYEWCADGGPDMNSEIWRLHEFHNKDGVLYETEPFSEQERDLLYRKMAAAAENFGFHLQQWGNRWYLSRFKDWGVQTRPWRLQRGRKFDENAYTDNAEGSFRKFLDCVEHLLRDSPVSKSRASAGFQRVDGLYPDGGSRRRLIKKNDVRAVLADAGYIRGWAQNAGLLSHRTVKLRGSWPEAPEGSLLAVVDTLYESYRNKDWERWRSLLPEVLSQAGGLAATAKKRRAGTLMLVASGRVTARVAQFSLNRPFLFSGNLTTKDFPLERLLKEEV